MLQVLKKKQSQDVMHTTPNSINCIVLNNSAFASDYLYYLFIYGSLIHLQSVQL